ENAQNNCRNELIEPNEAPHQRADDDIATRQRNAAAIEQASKQVERPEDGRSQQRAYQALPEGSASSERRKNYSSHNAGVGDDTVDVSGAQIDKKDHSHNKAEHSVDGELKRWPKTQGEGSEGQRLHCL